MDIPDWLVWTALGLSALQILALLSALHRLRTADPDARPKARLDLLDTVAGLLLFSGVSMSLAVAESWFWLALVGIALMTAVYALKGALLLRDRRRRRSAA